MVFGAARLPDSRTGTKAIVWQYGVTDRPGHTPGYLFCPDSFDHDVFHDWRGVAGGAPTACQTTLGRPAHT